LEKTLEMRFSVSRKLPEIEETYKRRFGERFANMSLVAVEEIFWPIYKHDLILHLREQVELSVFEEGLVRLVGAGVASSSEIAQFLGVSQNYTQKLAHALADSGNGLVPPPLILQDDKLFPGDSIQMALDRCERLRVRLEQATLFREAIAGTCLGVGEIEFNPVTPNSEDVDVSRWLGSRTETNWQGNTEVVNEMLPQLVPAGAELLNSELDLAGRLDWLQIYVGCYVDPSGKEGRYLLFNPGKDDQPLEELTSIFEEMLREQKVPPLYYPDDEMKTAYVFWEGMGAVLEPESLKERIVSLEEHINESIAVQQKKDEAVRRVIPAKALPDDSTLTLGDKKAELKVYLSAGKAAAKLNDAARGVLAYREAVNSLLMVVGLSDGHPVLVNDPGEILRYVADSSFRAPMEPTDMERLHQHWENCEHLLDVFRRERQGGSAPFWEWLEKKLDDVEELALRIANVSGEEEIKRQPEFDSMEVRYYEEMAHTLDGTKSLKDELDELRQKLDQAPKIRYLRTKDHPLVLQEALATAQETVIIVSPWIKQRALRKNRILEGIAGALERGCEVWIGHGMPYEDTSDPAALRQIDELKSLGHLYRVEGVRTHEKVLICDAKFYVIGSFNWLSYAAQGRRPDRRESSVYVAGGGVAERRNEYLRFLQHRLKKSAPQVQQ
jgi:hypothetical protein